MKKPRPSKTNVVKVDRVKNLAAGLRRALTESGWSERGLAMAAGLKPDRLRNVNRGLSSTLPADVLARVADTLAVPATALTGTEAWPSGGARLKRSEPPPELRPAFRLTSDPMADLLRASEEAAAAANMAAAAARQAAASVRLALTRRPPAHLEVDPIKGPIGRKAKAGKVSELDRIAKRLAFEGRVIIIDAERQVQLGASILSADYWVPFVAVTELPDGGYMLDDLVLGTTVSMHTDGSEAAEAAIRHGLLKARTLNSRTLHPHACAKIRALGGGEDEESWHSSRVDYALIRSTDGFFTFLQRELADCREWMSGGPEQFIAGAIAQLNSSVERFDTSGHMDADTLRELAFACQETCTLIRRFRNVRLSGGLSETKPLASIAFLELAAERLMRIAALGPTSIFQNSEVEARNSKARLQIPALGLPT